MIALLEREATGVEPADAVPHAEDDEAWGEYIIDLSDLVRTLGDVRSLRGLALLGIQTSRANQQFVASYGAQAIPALERARGAWSRSKLRVRRQSGQAAPGWC